MTGALNDLAAQHIGRQPGSVRAACPVCGKGKRDHAVSITVESAGSAVAHCHRCGASGGARAHDPLNGSKRPAARARRAPEDHRALWESGVEPGESFEHAYLARKQVSAHGIRVAGDLLLVPMRNAEGELVGVQKIAPDGTKLYTRGARKTGAYHLIGKPEGRIVIAEGYATGASIHEATGDAVAIAFDCGNLIHVAKSLRAKSPALGIVIAADDDYQSAGNPGLTRASEVARAIGAKLAAPRWPDGADRGSGTDFNDLRNQCGDEGVRQCIPEATAEARDGACLLDALHDYLCTFVVYPSPHAAIAHALWVAHAHLMDAWESTPRIAFLSPEPGSGKTRALEITETLVPRPVEAINATPAYLFRKVSDPAGLPTILYDEIDTLFGPKAKDNEEIRGILNAGHRRGAVAGRCVVKGKIVETEELPAYCAVALAGLGALPDTIISRSVVIRMRRRAPGETVEPYRRREHARIGNSIRDTLADWAGSVGKRAATLYPDMPEGVTDRAADVWEALLAVADLAGGEWPQRGRVAAVTLVTDAMVGTPSLGVRLLADLRQVFGTEDAMFTVAILEKLVAVEEAPWCDLKGKPLDARKLANLLRPYNVTSKLVRTGQAVGRGYTREDLHDPWARYLPLYHP